MFEDSDFLVLDKLLLIVGFFVGVNTLLFKIIESRNLNQKAKLDEILANTQPLVHKKANKLDPGSVNSLIVFVSNSTRNIIPYYLIHYFKPNKIAIVCSDDPNAIKIADNFREYLLGRRKIFYTQNGDLIEKEDENIDGDNIEFPEYTAASFVTPKNPDLICNYYAISSVQAATRRAIKQLDVGTGSVGVDVTSATAVCSIALYLLALDEKIEPVYALKVEGEKFGAHITPEDVRNLPRKLKFNPENPTDNITITGLPYYRQKKMTEILSNLND